MTHPARNLELKARLAGGDLPRLRDRLEALTCAPIVRLHQVDTYLIVARGRLKLRELRAATDPATVERAELVAYARPDDTGSRWSDYMVVPLPTAAVPAFLAALQMTHDTLARVEKVRHVGIIGATRVHLDAVNDLGDFIELETVIAAQSPTDAEAEHRQVIALLGIGGLAPLPGSYSDLIRAAGAP